MHWLIKCRSKPDTDALRAATIEAHRNFLDGYPQQTWYSGPLFSDDNQHAIGSLRLIEFADRAAAQDYINADPYTRAGIFAAIDIERWTPELDIRQRDYPRQDGTMQFVMHSQDAADGEAHRAPLRAAHADYMHAHRNILVTHGPLHSDDGTRALGCVLIVDVADKAQAEAFWSREPFNAAGVYAATSIERWRFGHV